MHGAIRPGRDGQSAAAGAGRFKLFGALLGTPFLIGGLVILWAGDRNWAAGEPEKNWVVTLAFGALSTAAGGGVIAAAWLGRRKWLERVRLEQRHPGKPWMWRPDWAQGRADSDAQTWLYAAWLLAAFSNVVAWVIAAAARDQLARLDGKALLIALFPLVGLGFLAWAATATLRYRKLGVSQLELSTLPGVLGGRLAGRIDTTLPEPPRDGARLRLDCLRVTGWGEKRNERLLWKSEKRVPASRLSRGWRGVSIPVEFSIPQDAQETREGIDRIIWRLSVDAELEGLNFRARFEAPVFRVQTG